MICGMWLSDNRYKFWNTQTGKNIVVMIPSAPNLSEQHIQEIIDWQKERCAAELGEPLPRKMSKTEQHDLGAILLAHRASAKRRLETNSPRYHEVLKP